MVQKQILVVDDEESILELLKYNLTKENYGVDLAVNGEDALNMLAVKNYSLILLDLMLPGIDGFEVCRRIKNDPKKSNTPIIMLTAKGEESDIVAGLELGADDYIVKPFSPKVLIARIRLVLRRKAGDVHVKDSNINIHGIKIDSVRHRVTIKGKEIDLTATEFKLLSLLAGNPDQVFTRNNIIKLIKGDNYPVTDRSIDVQIVSLRKKMLKAGENIQTIRGVGYRFKGM